MKPARPTADWVRVSVLYPSQEGARFDWTYYTEQHIPLVQRLLGSALKGVAVEEGLSGRTADSPPRYVAIAHLTFESLESYQTAMGAGGAEIRADVPKFTTIQPVLQISRIRMAQ